MNFDGSDTNRASLPHSFRLVEKINRGIIDDYGEVKFIAEVFPVLGIYRFPGGRPRSAAGRAPPGFGMLPGAPRGANKSENSLIAARPYRIASGACRWQSKALAFGGPRQRR